LGKSETKHRCKEKTSDPVIGLERKANCN